MILCVNGKKIPCVVGMRPEAIKVAPVIFLFWKEPRAGLKVLAKAQHKQMLD